MKVSFLVMQFIILLKFYFFIKGIICEYNLLVIKMDTNKVLIGDVYQITKWERNQFQINYAYYRIKDNALLFRQPNNTYMDIETKLIYESNLNSKRQIGDAIVFSGDVIPFNSFLDEKDRCNDVPEDDVVEVYQMVKTKIKKS